MIFVILGTQKFQFNRLLKQIDRLIEEGIIDEEVFAQIGYSTYKPLNYQTRGFLDKSEFNQYIKMANIIITHGGTGSIVTALQNNKKVIAAPRLAKYGEHVDDHQIEICTVMKHKEYIEVIDDMNNLSNLIKSVKNNKYKVFKSNNKNIIRLIENFITEF